MIAIQAYYMCVLHVNRLRYRYPESRATPCKGVSITICCLVPGKQAMLSLLRNKHGTLAILPCIIELVATAGKACMITIAAYGYGV